MTTNSTTAKLSWLPAVAWSQIVGTAWAAFLFVAFHSLLVAFAWGILSAAGAMIGFSKSGSDLNQTNWPAPLGQFLWLLTEVLGCDCGELFFGVIALCAGLIVIFGLLWLGALCGWIGRQFAESAEWITDDVFPTSLVPRQFSLLDLFLFTSAVAVIVFFGRFFLAAPDRLLGWFGLMVITQLLLILLLDYLHEQSPTHRS